MKINNIFLILSLLIVVSIAASYLHRYFVANTDIEPDLPVITDSVIPAIETNTVSAAS